MILFLTQDKDFFPVPLKDKFAYLKDFGFDGFEIDGKLLLKQFEVVKEAAQKTDFPVITACGGYEGWIGDFDEAKRQKGLEDISLILRRLGQLKARGIVVPAAWGMFSLRLPPMIPPRQTHEDEEVILNSLQRLNKVAHENDVSIFLEPLNRYEDHMINTLSKARYYIEEGGFSNIKIIADFYHMNIEEARIDESIHEHKDYIGHIHLADSHRYQPGSGHIDFQKGFEALKQINYAGAMAYECRVTGNNPEQEYRKSFAYLKNIYEKTWSN